MPEYDFSLPKINKGNLDFGKVISRKGFTS